jgi:hypothetical protein
MATKINWFGISNGKNNLSLTESKDISFLGIKNNKKKKKKGKDKEVNWINGALYTPSKKNFSVKTRNFPMVSSPFENVKTKKFPATVRPFPFVSSRNLQVSSPKDFPIGPSRKKQVSFLSTNNSPWPKSKSKYKNKAPGLATFYKPVKMKTPSFLSSESSLYGRTNLRRYGDKDFDGSPNAFDCSPRNVRKDGIFSKILHTVTGGRMGQSDEEYAAEKEEKRMKTSEDIEPYKIPSGQQITSAETGETFTPGEINPEVEKTISNVAKMTKKYEEEQLEKAEAEEERYTKEQKKEARTALSEKYGYHPVEYTVRLSDGTEQTRVRYEINKDTERAEKFAAQEEQLQLAKLEKGLKTKSLADTEAYLQGKRKVLKAKYIPKFISGETYNPATKQYEASGILPALSSLGSTVGGAFASEKFVNLINPYAQGTIPATATGEWTPQAKTAGYKIRKKPAALIAAMLPPGVLTKDVEKIAKQAVKYPTGAMGRKKGKKGEYYEYESAEPRGKSGRPKGTFKNYIPGRGPVGIYEYRKYARKQKAIARMSGPQYQQQYAAPTIPTQYEPTRGINDQGNYDYSQYQAPQIYNQANVPPDQAVDLQNQAQMYQRATWNQRYQEMMAKMNPYQQAQLNEQMSDNPLNAPNFMKGELTNVGGPNSMTYTSPENNVLNAPNVNLGQMRNVGSYGEQPAVRLSERPVTNPRGDQYTEIDPVSGKVMLKRRISEKWATGEAY